jgi:hypothetical protein
MKPRRGERRNWKRDFRRLRVHITSDEIEWNVLIAAMADADDAIGPVQRAIVGNWRVFYSEPEPWWGSI